jgi:tripartite-type tricarboxylate transporter receptor subunit TctC
MRRRLVLPSLALAMAAPAALAQAPADNRPLRVLVGFTPGGSADLAARTIADGIGAALGRQVIIENRPGAGSIIAATAVSRAEPDGGMLLFGSISLSVLAAVDPALPIDLVNDLVPIGLVAEGPNVLVVNPQLPVKSVRELIAWAKANPASFASGGVATTQHLAGEMFKEAAKIDIVHVPYKGSGPALADIMGGRIEMMFDNVSSSNQLIRAGKLRALAVTTAKRTRQLPDVPTMVELGFENFETSVWFGIFAPNRTPKEVADRIAAAIATALSDPKAVARYEALGMDVLRSDSPEKFAEFFRRDVQRWKATVARAGIKVEKS